MLLESILMKISFWKRKNTNICFPRSLMRLFLVLSFLVQIIQSHWEKILEFYQRCSDLKLRQTISRFLKCRWCMNDRKQLSSERCFKLLRWLYNYSKVQRVAVAQSQISSREGNCSDRSLLHHNLKGYLKSICQKDSCGLKVWFLFFSLNFRTERACHSFTIVCIV